ncbi:Fanconi anemia group B protein [Platysternon megacephalum]|uniref:Fanconi anemia group B protein n=1 Tax=Platysternon megacephalum TaxID=55544 RepID=A0A4D9ENP1_9SAUR|nr:Fanconi anemia group B protein [Platysternon megacephalum]
MKARRKQKAGVSSAGHPGNALLPVASEGPPVERPYPCPLMIITRGRSKFVVTENRAARLVLYLRLCHLIRKALDTRQSWPSIAGESCRCPHFKPLEQCCCILR